MWLIQSEQSMAGESECYTGYGQHVSLLKESAADV